MSRSRYEVAIVGGGPAGLSAALVLARFRRSVVVLDAGQQRNLATHAVHNYLGLEGISPRELLRRGREEARRAGAELRKARVTGIRRRGGDFVVSIEDQPDLVAARIILATSLVDMMPDIPELDRFYGRTIFHCPVCDAADFVDQPLVVVSWGQYADGFTLELFHWTKKLILTTQGRPIADRQRARLERYGVEVVTERIERLEGQDDRLSAVVLEDGRRIPCRGLFFSIGHKPRNELAVGLGCEITDEGYVVVNEHYETTVPGVYAAGDITTLEEAVADAVAEGLIAATNISLSLHEEVYGEKEVAEAVA
jgi:thioredoxin reductase